MVCVGKEALLMGQDIDLKPGTILRGKQSRYIIQDTLKERKFSIVYRALDQQNKIVVIKECFITGGVFPIYRNSDSMAVHIVRFEQTEEEHEENKEYFQKCVNMLEKEAEVLYQFKNNNEIVHSREFFQANNTAYLITDYISGKNLLQVLQSIPTHRLMLMDIMMNIAPIIQTLKKIRNQDKKIFIDICPQNIVFASDGTIKLLGVGSAEMASTRLEYHQTEVIFPNCYDSKDKENGPWSDVYGLAMTIYRVITGRNPAKGIELPSDLGIEITQWQEIALMKGLAKDFHYRYQNLDEFYQAMIIHSEEQVSEKKENLHTDEISLDQWASFLVILLVVGVFIYIAILLIARL